jgi:hypothetical protein
MQSYKEHAGELSDDPVRSLKGCPFCGGCWQIVPIPQTCRYSAIGICVGCGAMVMTVDEHATLASAISELIRRINARGNSDCNHD